MRGFPCVGFRGGPPQRHHRSLALLALAHAELVSALAHHAPSDARSRLTAPHFVAAARPVTIGATGGLSRWRCRAVRSRWRRPRTVLVRRAPAPQTAASTGIGDRLRRGLGGRDVDRLRVRLSLSLSLALASIDRRALSSPTATMASPSPVALHGHLHQRSSPWASRALPRPSPFSAWHCTSPGRSWSRRRPGEWP